MSKLNWAKLACPINLGRQYPIVKQRQEDTVGKILRALATRPGVILADEVGMGKTYMAIGVASAVLAAGGRVQVCVPHGILSKWKRDFLKCSENLDTPDSRLERILATPTVIEDYADVFWNRAGVVRSPKDQLCASELKLWHPGATEFSFVSGQGRATNWYNDNICTFLISIMAAFPRGLTRQRRWWGEELADNLPGNWGLFATHINGLGKKHKIRLPEEVTRLKEILQGKRSARSWWIKEGLANRELRDLINDKDCGLPQKLWLSYAGIPDLLILDEAHKGKSDSSRLQRILELFRGRPVRVLALTATPFDLDAEELKRLLDRIVLADRWAQGVGPVIVARFKNFSAARNTFVEQWEIASREAYAAQKRVLAVPLPVRLEQARAEICEAKLAYERVLGPWMIRASKTDVDPYKKFEEEFRRLTSGKQICSAHTYRNYDQEGHDVIELENQSGAAAEGDFETFLWLERLEIEARATMKIIGQALDPELLRKLHRETGAERLIGTTHFMYVGNAYDYLDVKDYIDTLEEFEKNLRKAPGYKKCSARDEINGRLARVLELAKRVKGKVLSAAHHPKLRRAFDLITGLSEPVNLGNPAAQERKILLFSFAKKPLHHLHDELSRHATRQMLPYLDSLYTRLKMRLGGPSTALPRWSGLKTGQDVDLFLQNFAKPYTPERLFRVLNVPNALRNRKNWRSEVLELMALPAMQAGGGKLGVQQRETALAFVFSPLNLARWSSSLADDENLGPAGLWRFSQANGVHEIINKISFRARHDSVAGDILNGGEPSGSDGDTPDDLNIRSRLNEVLKLTTREMAWCQYIDGEKSLDQRWALQSLFNTKGPPYVLLAQSTICREGIDLHEFCMHLVHFDLEWAPGAMEQREGRLDRVGSAWEQAFDKWCKSSEGKPPQIEVFALRMQGHYDDRRWERLRRRQADLVSGMGASIVGSLSTGESEVKNLMPFEDENKVRELLPQFKDFRPVSKIT